MPSERKTRPAPRQTAGHPTIVNESRSGFKQGLPEPPATETAARLCDHMGWSIGDPATAGRAKEIRRTVNSSNANVAAPWEASDSVGLVHTQTFRIQSPFELESGTILPTVDVAYETYGRLNARGDNAILICHALTGDAHVAGWSPESARQWQDEPDRAKPGWWDSMIGPGKAFDTNRYFVVCSNVLGGCMGTTGPSSINPYTGKPWGTAFPIVTVNDMVEVQRHLMDHLGIEQWLSMTGGSLGGMQVLAWATRYPQRIRSVIPIATAAALSPQGIAFNATGRRAIVSDPDWQDGSYYESPVKPEKGLAIARMIGHITYLSETSMQAKFGRQGKPLSELRVTDNQFEVENYLEYQGHKFTRRFDANTYLYVTKAMDIFDLRAGAEDGDERRSLARVLAGSTRPRWLVFSFSSDWLFPPPQSRELVSALRANLADVTYYEIQSTYGHDAFLLEVEELTDIIRMFLDRVEAKGESRFVEAAAEI